MTPPRSSSVVPCLRYAGPDAALDFLRRAFGFAEHFVARDGESRVAHAQLVLGGGMVMIGPAADPALHDWQPPRYAGGVVTGCTYVLVADADAHHARAAAAGAAVPETPADRPCGGRDYIARDPEGNLWSFGTYDPWAAKT